MKIRFERIFFFPLVWGDVSVQTVLQGSYTLGWAMGIKAAFS